MGIESSFSSFFNKKSEEQKQAARAEQAPQGFLENLSFVREQMKEKQNSDLFWDLASEQLKFIVSEAQKNEQGKTYYKEEVLSVLSEMATQEGWTDYKNVDIQKLKDKLHALYSENKAGSPDDDAEPLKDMLTRD